MAIIKRPFQICRTLVTRENLVWASSIFYYKPHCFNHYPTFIKIRTDKIFTADKVPIENLFLIASQRLIYGVVAGLKVRLTSPYTTKIGKFIEFFYLFICIGKFYEFSGANTPKH